MPKAERRRSAAIEVGPNVVRLLVAEFRTGRDGRLALRQLEQRVKLLDAIPGSMPGEPPGRVPALDEASIAALVAQVVKYVAAAMRAGAGPLIALAGPLGTSSVDAGPAGAPAGPVAELADAVEEAVGLPARVLTARRQAELAFLGVRGSLEPRGPQLIIDAGETATHLIICDGRERETLASVPVGAAGLAAALPGDPPSVLEWALEAISLGRLLAALPEATPALAWATGASAHTLVGLEGQREPGLATRLSLADLGRIADELLHTSARKLARRSGEEPRRVGQLAPAALILAAFLRRYELEWCTVLPAGLRDGIVLAEEAQPEAWWRDAPTEAAPPAAADPGTAADAGSATPAAAAPTTSAFDEAAGPA